MNTAKLIATGAVALLALRVSAQQPAAKPQVPMPKYSYWDNWTDHNGVSHMTHCEVSSFMLSSMSPPADPQWQSKQPESGAQVIFTVQPAGWKGAWHEDPKPQWIIPLKGTWFVQAMDGTRATLGPGDISLGEDQNTVPDAQGHKGHLAGNVSKGPVSLMVIQLAVTPTVDQPCRFNGALAMPTIPTRGIDHVGITVPNLDAASHFFEQALGAVPLYDNITRSQPPMQGAEAEKELDLAPGTKLITMRMMKLAHGPGLELFEMKGPTQRPPARPSDFGLQHIAVYVDDMDASLRRFVAAGGTILSGPNVMLGLEKGDGNSWAYAQAPWGTVIELLTYPGKEDYEKNTNLRRWTPQP